MVQFVSSHRFLQELTQKFQNPDNLEKVVCKTYTNHDYGKLFANYEEGDAVSDHEDISPDQTPTIKVDRKPLGATNLEI